MSRIYNFAAGPAVLPLPVLEKAASELTEYKTTGQSVMEMSHRSAEFKTIYKECEALFREVMSVPNNYKILFIQGGASMQFSMIPMNLLTKTKKADYVISGQFSKKAYEEALKFGTSHLVATSENDHFSHIPYLDKRLFNQTADYFHICLNNTVYGTRYTSLPDTGTVPLVADASSCILSEPMDVSKFGIIYAGVQKNIAPAGMAVAIVREDLIQEPLPGTPLMLSYKTYAEHDSMYNTPPTYTIYMMKLVLEWIKYDMQGLKHVKLYNDRKASILYRYLDDSDFYIANAAKENRSIMNVTFRTANATLDELFCKEAREAGLYNLKGHRAAGGMRASIYNAMPIEGVKKLVDFMEQFAKKEIKKN